MEEYERIRKYSIDYEGGTAMNRVVSFDELLDAFDGKTFWLEHPPQDKGWDGVYSVLTIADGKQLEGERGNWVYNEKTRSEYNRLYRAWEKPFRPTPIELAMTPWKEVEQ